MSCAFKIFTLFTYRAIHKKVCCHDLLPAYYGKLIEDQSLISLATNKINNMFQDRYPVRLSSEQKTESLKMAILVLRDSELKMNGLFVISGSELKISTLPLDIGVHIECKT